jgi:hypothetical protein
MVSNLEPNQAILRRGSHCFYTNDDREEDFDTYEIIEYKEDCLTVQHTLGYFLSTMTQAILGGF